MLHAISGAILLIIGAGYWFRRRLNIHPKFMFTAFALDLALVLYIELTRGAVEQVASEFKALLWFHAGVSTVVVVLYVAMIVLGRRLQRGEDSFRPVHRMLGYAFVVLRSANFATSFMV